MKQIFLGIFAIFGISLILVAPSMALNTSNFAISSFDIRYELSKDGEGRSILRTTETITAQFPNFDQNHGIERAIPQSYDGHTTDIQVESITTLEGSSWSYSTRTDNDNLVLRIGEADRYVQGEQTYVIIYTQSDVTKTFDNTNSDEFYWDTNGTEWKVPIERLTISLKLSDSVRKSLAGKMACYKGDAGATNTCSLVNVDGTLTTQANNLSPGENVTVAIGFTKGTFSQYKVSLWDTIVQLYIVITVVLVGLALASIIFIAIKYDRLSGRKREVGTIIPEYIPPSDTSLTASASIATPAGSIFTAQLLDFAVRHYIKIYQTKEKSFLKAAEYDIEIIKDIASLKSEEQEILRDIFQDDVAVGKRLSMKSLQNNSTVYIRTLDNDKKMKALVRGEYGLRERDIKKAAWFKKFGWILLGLGIIAFNPALLIASVVSFIAAYSLWPLTDKGLALFRYLEGMKLYIKVAEQERLAMLQSPEGAVKVKSVDINDPSQLIKLYERVLPYAVLFGQEKEWSKRIGELYQSSQSTPSWYGGTSAFNAAAFGSAMSSFSSAVSYSSASSSSSGGSSGGGSSGGGGGGGGGGGW